MIIVVCESVPTSVSGKAMRRAVGAVARHHDLAEIFEVHLVDDAGAGRDDAEVLEGLLRPAQQRVALAVALVLALDVEGEGARVAEGVHLHRVVDDEVGGDEWIDAGGVAAHVV